MKYQSYLVFIASLVYSLYLPTLETALLTLCALCYHALAIYLEAKQTKSSNLENLELEALKLSIAEVKDDLTKVKIAHSFKR